MNHETPRKWNTSNARTRGVASWVLAIVLVVSAAPASAAESEASQIGLNAASAGLTLLYGPAKIVYAVLGLVFGGVAYGLSGGDGDVVKAVISPAVRGDYYVTPDHLQMKKSLEFVGRDPSYPEKVVESAVYEENY